MDTEIAIDPKTIKLSFWHMPRLFYLILFIEFCERFAYYGFQSLVITYAIKKNINVANIGISLASFNMLLYAFIVIGGIVGDKVLGLRRTYIFGILFLFIGYSSLFFFQSLLTFNFGIILILIGSILFKANATHYISRCFESNDSRLDLAYTYFYMFMNMGCCLSIILIPILYKIDSNIAVFSSSAMMLLAILLYLIFKKEFVYTDNYIGKNSKNLYLLMLITIGLVVALVYFFGLLLTKLYFCQYILYLFSALTILTCLFISIKFDKHESKGIYLALNLILIAVIFWIIFLQILLTIALFSLHYVRFNLFGYNVSNDIVHYFGVFSIVFLTPFLASVYIYLQKRRNFLSIPLKFNIGLMLLGLSLIILSWATKYALDVNSQISVLWLFLVEALLAIALLLVLAIGPSMVSQLFPKRIGAFAQGVWFLAIAIGILVSNKIFTFIYVAIDVSISNIINMYSNLFFKSGLVVIIFSLFLLFFSKILVKKIQEVIIHRI